ncbi:1-deoxy-D-xylulose-5-phosphate synthase [Fodinisporobacter ferrooxydans]|uniref:1-deoxy-D-xylulose-5-phosphate synthase n=1 Tax=Fodinisporobacter ferrooxydans TaxID=2901836 RepID=A0ABY4CQ78_9BACL|nr:1-deoxy-D-xylulose-5-phosphate synthase [Alicyclobacillaceae bacterium MYW30-H2]
MRSTFVKCLIEQAKADERIFLITPDLGYSVLEEFANLFPNRFLNVGIAEQNAIGIASGLALSGKIVYVYSIIPFITMRCFEQIRVDVAYMETNVRIVGVGAGLSYGPQGATHHAIEDIAIMRSLPNMTVCCPGDPVEVRNIMEQSLSINGPIYIRLGRNGEASIHNDNVKFKIGQAIKVSEGKDLVLFTTSNMLEQGEIWVKKLREKGKSVTHISMPTIKPIDKSIINEVIELGVPIISLEEHSIIGGLGSAISEIIAESGKAVNFKRIGINDSYSHYVGNHEFLRSKFGLEDILEEVLPCERKSTSTIDLYTNI